MAWGKDTKPVNTKSWATELDTVCKGGSLAPGGTPTCLCRASSRPIENKITTLPQPHAQPLCLISASPKRRPFWNISFTLPLSLLCILTTECKGALSEGRRGQLCSQLNPTPGTHQAQSKHVLKGWENRGTNERSN